MYVVGLRVRFSSRIVGITRIHVMEHTAVRTVCSVSTASDAVFICAEDRDESFPGVSRYFRCKSRTCCMYVRTTIKISKYQHTQQLIYVHIFYVCTRELHREPLTYHRSGTAAALVTLLCSNAALYSYTPRTTPGAWYKYDIPGTVVYC